MHELRLRDAELPDGGRSTLTGRVDDVGDLHIEGFDFGPTVRNVFGASDYEYGLRVARENVPRLLLLLLREHFTTGDRGVSESALMDWLKRNAVPTEWDTWHSDFS